MSHEKTDKKRSTEDQEVVKKKKKFKKDKKAKEKVIDDSSQVIEENVEEHQEDGNANIKEVKKGPSKRQLKREKAELRAAITKEANKQETTQKALNYISKWKHARSQWKFEKVRQIWLIQNILSDECIPDDYFPMVLDYFEGCKGSARQQLIDKAMTVVRKAEDNNEDSDVLETAEYKRARQLLQILPAET